jgi:hypothetical protein
MDDLRTGVQTNASPDNNCRMVTLAWQLIIITGTGPALGAAQATECF